MAWTSFVSDWTQRRVETFFYHLGVKVYQRPVSFLMGGIFLTLLGSVGFINFVYENDVIDLWIPQESEIYENYERTIDLFGEYDADMQIVVSHRNGDNLLTPEYMNLVYCIFNQSIDEVNVKYNYKGQKKWYFDDLCARNYPSYPTCTSQESGFFSLFGFNPLVWQTQESIQNQIDAVGDALAFFVGGLIINESTGQVSGGSYILLTLTLEGTFDDKLTEIRDDYENEWEDYWEDHAKDYKSYGLNIDFFNSVSLQNEMDRVVFDDIPLLATAFTIMMLYLAVTLGRKINWIETRLALAVCALWSVNAAMLIGFGFGLAVGWYFNVICLIIPYILIGVGVDGDLIIIETFNTALEEARAEREMSKNDKNINEKKDEKDDELSEEELGHAFGMALKHAGLSISLTSLSSIVAFAIGATIDIPGISAFCSFASAAFTANYVTQFIIFAPCYVLDERRVSQNRNCFLCCIKHDAQLEEPQPRTNNNNKHHHTTNTSQNEGKPVREAEMAAGVILGTQQQQQQHSNNSEESSQTQTIESSAATGASDASHTSTTTTSKANGTNEMENDDDDESQFRCSVSFILSEYLAKYLAIRWVRIVILFIFSGWFAASLVSLQWISTDSDVTVLVPDGSYVLDFFDTLEDGFGQVVFGRMHYVVENADFSDKSTRDSVLNMVEELQNPAKLNSEYGESVGNIEQWIGDFIEWGDVNFNISLDEIDSNNEIGSVESIQFYDLLKLFTNDTIEGFKRWEELILYNYQTNENDLDVVSNVKATKFTSQFEFIYDIKDRWNLYDDMTDVIDDNLEICSGTTDCSGYIYSSDLELSYLSYVIVELIISNLVASILGVLIMLLFLLDLRLSLMVTCCIIMIDVDLLGWMYINDMPLDMLSYAQLVMAVGLTVDYVVHMAHSVVDAAHVDENGVAQVKDFGEQLSESFVGIGTGVFKGAFTTFLGVLLLAFASSAAFRSFFVMFVGIIFVSLLHGFFFIPAVLGEMKCIYTKWDCCNKMLKRDANDSNNSNNSNDERNESNESNENETTNEQV